MIAVAVVLLSALQVELSELVYLLSLSLSLLMLLKTKKPRWENSLVVP